MAEVEVWTGHGRERVIALDGSSVIIGSDGSAAGLTLADPTVSAVHAVLDRVGSTWLVSDLGSTNGTRVGSERINGQRRLRDGDEVVVGRTRLVFRDRQTQARSRTDALAPPPPDITRTERQVLVELCRPLLSHNVFQPPASVREISERLYVGKNAVQAHLVSLYRKFDIHDGDDRRVQLANEAMQRGAVTRDDLLPPQPGPRAGS